MPRFDECGDEPVNPDFRYPGIREGIHGSQFGRLAAEVFVVRNGAGSRDDALQGDTSLSGFIWLVRQPKFAHNTIKG